MKPVNVLFLCTGNSARSILAEAILNRRGWARGFVAFSAGSKPAGQPHPTGLVELARRGHRIDLAHSKSWDAFGDGPPMDIVVTVCDAAAAESCPVWPRKDGAAPVTVHWPAPDPAHIEDAAKRERAFAQVYDLMSRRIDGLLALPDENLRDREALQALA